VTAIELTLVLILVRILSPPVWNRVAVVLTIYGTCRALGQLSIQEGIYYFYTQVESARRRGLILQTAFMLWVSALVMCPFILSLSSWLPTVTPEVQRTLPVLALAVMLELPSTCAPQTLIASERPSWASAYSTTTSLIYMVCVGVPLLSGWGLFALAVGILVSATTRFFAFATTAWFALPKGRLHIDWKLLARQTAYTAPLALSVASTVLNRYIDKWIVSVFEPDKLGAYTFAATELPFVTALGNAMAAVLSTRMAYAFHAQKTGLALRYWLASSARGAFIVGPVTVGIMLVVPDAIAGLFDPVYAISLLPFQLYNSILFQRVMGYGMVMRSAGATKTLWALSVALLGLNAVFSVPLTMALGIAGAALGTLLGTAVVFVLTMFVFSRILQAPVRRVFPWGIYGFVLLLALAAAIVTEVVTASVDGPVLRMVLKILVYAPLYLVPVWLLRVHRRLPEVPADDEEFTRRMSGPEPSQA
jgi:O-antigen/teichoic acid export membrane protein